MATQHGIIHLTGTLGDVNFYLRKGKPVLRQAGGGFSGSAIQTKPSMARVRENAGEFGRVSKAKKALRLGLLPFLKDVRDVTLHGRMMQLFQEIKVLDSVSARGERRFALGLATDAGQRLLQGFAFTPKKASALLPGVGVYDRAAQEYHITAISLKGYSLPTGATGVRVVFGVLDVDFETGDSALHQSAPLYLDHHFMSATVTLAPTVLPAFGGIRMGVLQVRFYQELNGARYLFGEVQGVEVLGCVV